MKRTDVPAAIEQFKQQHGDIRSLEPRLIGFSWAIGIQGDNVVLARKYPLEIYEFSLMAMKNYQNFIDSDKDWGEWV